MKMIPSSLSAAVTLTGRAASVFAFVFIPVAIAVAQPAPPKTGDAPCVGVVSAIGDTLVATKLGFTIFNNEENKFSIEAWHIDDVVFGKIVAALGKRTNVKRVSVPKGSFAVLEQDHGPFYSPDEDIRAVLQRITTSTKCSQYIAVVKTRLQFKAGQRIDGLGVQAQGGQYFAWALFTVELHDGRNLALIAKYPPSVGVNFLGRKQMPSREVDATWWPESNVQQNAKLRDGMRALVEKGLDGSLSDLPK
jgi:hypothetical protein